MPDYCCVPECKNSGTGHRFPSDPQLRKKWISAIKRLDPVTKKSWQPTNRSVVCRNHFADEDYTNTLLGERRRLKADAIPKLHIKDPSLSERAIRSRSRKRLHTCDVEPKTECEPEEILCDENMAVVEGISEVVVESSDSSLQTFADKGTSTPNSPADCSRTCSSSQTDISPRTFSIHNFKKEPALVKYYTSFYNYEHFMFLFSVLGPSVSHLGLENIRNPPEDQLFLTLMKLRQAKDDYELSFFFTLRPHQVSIVFNTWINFLFFQLEELSFWPESAVIKEHMPSHFAQTFPNTRVILDATEVPIQKPQSSGPQRETFSSYKNKNTLKVMVGCTPRGSVNYVSDAYGGTTSDRQIIERSNLVKDSSPLEKGDSIMADRGIMVQDLFASKDINVNTPTMLKGKSQLELEEVINDRKVASKRIHVERVIGLAKTYKILKKDLNSSLTTLGNRIIRVCFYLCNFRPAIVNRFS